MFYLAYTIGFLMVVISAYMIYTYQQRFKAVKVRTKNYLRYMRKVNEKR